jgi:signal transduction histidine kinase
VTGIPIRSSISAENALLTRKALETKRVQIIDDVQAAPLITTSSLFKDTQRQLQAALVLPLGTKDYQFGAVILGFFQRQKFDPEEISYFELENSQITLALKNSLQEYKIEKQLKEAHTLAAIEQALSQSETIGVDAVLQLIVNSARDIIPHTTHAILHLLDDTRQLLIPRAVAGNFEGRRSKLNMHMGQGVAGQVLLDGVAVTIPDIRTDRRFLNQTIPVVFRSMAVAPVILNQKRIGTISVHSAEPGSFQQDELQLLNSLATLSAIAIENASLYEAMQEEIQVRTRLQDALLKSIDSEHELRLAAETTAEASFALISSLDPEAVLNEILAQVEILMPGFAYHIELLEDDNFLSVRAHRGYENYGHDFAIAQRFPIERLPFQWEVLQKRKAIAVPDTRLDALWSTLPVYDWVRSHLSIPLLWKGQLLGILNIDHEQPNMLSEDSVWKLKTMVNVAAVAIANAQLLENTRQALNETSSLYEISQTLVALNVKELLEKTVQLLQKNFGYYHAQIYLRDVENRNLILEAASGEIGQTLLAQKRNLLMGVGIVGHVYETSMPFFSNRVDEVVFYVKDPILPDTTSEMAIPLRSGTQTYGVIDIHQSYPGVLTSRDVQLVGAVADQLAVALQNANLYENLQSALEQEKNTRFQLMQIERLATVGRLLASISHELNNPLQAIQNVLFLLKREEKLSEQGRQDLEVILLETERMTSLISRLRANYRTPKLDELLEINLNSIIEDVYALTATYMRHRKIAFEFCPDTDLPELAGIPDQIRQALLNLFMNAIDAMESGGRLMVQTQSLTNQKQILLTVSDTGRGISAEILPHLFEPFTTDKVAGTGLGMTITRDIVLQHQGQIKAENKPEGGALFTVWLPVSREV